MPSGRLGDVREAVSPFPDAVRAAANTQRTVRRQRLICAGGLSLTERHQSERVAPGSHGHAKRDGSRLLATRAKPHRYAQTRMRRPPPHVHGKEGVDGSSPSDCLNKSPVNGEFVLPVVARFRFFAGTRRVHVGTGGHSRARTASRDTAYGCRWARSRPSKPVSPSKRAIAVVRSGGARAPSSVERGFLLMRLAEEARTPNSNVAIRRPPGPCSGMTP